MPAAFKQVLAGQREELAKSNQTNLATATLHLEESIREVEAHLVKMKALLVEIEEAGDSAEIMADASGSITRKLWHRARQM